MGRPREHATQAHKQSEYRRRLQQQREEERRKAAYFDKLVAAARLALTNGNFYLPAMLQSDDFQLIEELIDRMSGQTALPFMKL